MVHSVTKANIQLGEDVVVIGGGIMEDENVFNMVTSKVSELTAPGFDVNIRSARFGNSAGLIGAGILAQKLMK